MKKKSILFCLGQCFLQHVRKRKKEVCLFKNTIKIEEGTVRNSSLKRRPMLFRLRTS